MAAIHFIAQFFLILLYIAGALIGLVLLLILLYYVVFELPLRLPSAGFRYVYVEEDGSVRELDEQEQEYLNTKFHPTDGGRPYIKWRYGERTPDNRISGFLPRKRLPFWMAVTPLT